MEPQDRRNFTVKRESPETLQLRDYLQCYAAADDEQRSIGNGEIIEENRRGRARENDAENQKNPPQKSLSSSADSKCRLGRPPGTGKLQRLASLGVTACGSFTPHVVLVAPGEDIVNRISTFSVAGPRTIFIISTIGLVSTVILHQPDSLLASTLRFEGMFEILKLSGWFYGGDQMKPITIAFSKSNGHVFGGSTHSCHFHSDYFGKFQQKK